jgi:predicted metal-dependent phosphoesterase TrpH
MMIAPQGVGGKRAAPVARTGGMPSLDRRRAPAYTGWRQEPPVESTVIKVDLHVHSYRSGDCLARPEELVYWMARRGLGAMAITDHNTIQGAREVAALAPGAIIIGEEIMTKRGEIIGLFLREHIPAQLSPRETIERIHLQGGLVYIPHPVDRFGASSLEQEAFVAVLPQIDLIEAFNARSMAPTMNRRATALAREHSLPMGAGSDAHRARDVGLAYVETPPFRDARTFLAALGEGQIHGRMVGLLGRLAPAHARFVKRRRERSDAKDLPTSEDC